jgi:hypothetical protein
MWRLGPTVLLWACVAGCDDDVLRPCTELTPDWDGVQCTLQQHCTSCHSEPHDVPPVAYTVFPEDLLADLLLEEHRLVVPGDPEASLLWRSISGELNPAIDGWGIMPWGWSEPLPRSEIEHVEAWILAGAHIERGL